MSSTTIFPRATSPPTLGRLSRCACPRPCRWASRSTEPRTRTTHLAARAEPSLPVLARSTSQRSSNRCTLAPPSSIRTRRGLCWVSVSPHTTRALSTTTLRSTSSRSGRGRSRTQSLERRTSADSPGCRSRRRRKATARATRAFSRRAKPTACRARRNAAPVWAQHRTA
eukprot:Amastigsp_a841759_83.p2 type:complete len:169 gc:universal Amastigsp_a841759_83:687-1193(+)